MILELVAPFRRTSVVSEGRVRRLAISMVQRYMPGARPCNGSVSSVKCLWTSCQRYHTECVLRCHRTVHAQRCASNDGVLLAHDHKRDAHTAVC